MSADPREAERRGHIAEAALIAWLQTKPDEWLAKFGLTRRREGQPKGDEAVSDKKVGGLPLIKVTGASNTAIPDEWVWGTPVDLRAYLAALTPEQRAACGIVLVSEHEQLAADARRTLDLHGAEIARLRASLAFSERQLQAFQARDDRLAAILNAEPESKEPAPLVSRVESYVRRLRSELAAAEQLERELADVRAILNTVRGDNERLRVRLAASERARRNLRGLLEWLVECADDPDANSVVISWRQRQAIDAALAQEPKHGEGRAEELTYCDYGDKCPGHPSPDDRPCDNDPSGYASPREAPSDAMLDAMTGTPPDPWEREAPEGEKEDENQRVQSGTHQRSSPHQQGEQHWNPIPRGAADAPLVADAASPAGGRRSERGDTLAAKESGATGGASPNAGTNGGAGEGSASRDGAGLTAPLTPEAPGVGEKCHYCGAPASCRECLDGRTPHRHPACSVCCGGTGTARPDARPAGVDARARDAVAASMRLSSSSSPDPGPLKEFEGSLAEWSAATIDYLRAQVVELQERLHMADTIAANAISVEMVLDLHKQCAEESYYAVAVRMDQRIAELQANSTARREAYAALEAEAMRLQDERDELQAERDSLSDQLSATAEACQRACDDRDAAEAKLEAARGLLERAKQTLGWLLPTHERFRSHLDGTEQDPCGVNALYADVSALLAKPSEPE